MQFPDALNTCVAYLFRLKKEKQEFNNLDSQSEEFELYNNQKHI